MTVSFADNARNDPTVSKMVTSFLDAVATMESARGVVIHQDGKSGGYYIKCTVAAEAVCPLLDMDARLDPGAAESLRANRQLLLDHNTYKRMLADAKEGREFNDIIVEYSTDYSPTKPLKVWGGQHRARAIQDAARAAHVSSYHGLRVYFALSKTQRTEIALISNTNIAVSNDLFDRLQEETLVGLNLRNWCARVGLLKEGEDFPDLGSRAERITVKLARTFVTNFLLGRDKLRDFPNVKIDESVYEPYLCESGVGLDQQYERYVKSGEAAVWEDNALLKAGREFAKLHNAQWEAVKAGSIKNLKGYRNKALTESVIAAWAFVAGLLQSLVSRLDNHYTVPKPSKAIPDPLNAQEMSKFKHDSDEPTYRGLGTRSLPKDRQRMAQLFLARSLKSDTTIDKKLMERAVSQVVGIKSLQKGYTSE